MNLPGRLASLMTAFLILAALACALSMQDAASAEDTGTIAEGNTRFALDLYDKLRSREGNLTFCPHTISATLAMTYAGARGNTGKEMAKVLHFDMPQSKLHDEFRNLKSHMRKAMGSEKIFLRIANALYVQREHRFNKDYLKTAMRNYGAGVNWVDFIRNHEAARQNMNKWVGMVTDKKEQELIPAGVLNPLTRLVLASAINFKGNWTSKFQWSKTAEAAFWLEPEKQIKAPTMCQKQSFGYGETDSIQILEMPFEEDIFSMILVLPKEQGGLASVEEKLTMENLKAWMALLKKEPVNVFLPKFKTGTTLNLNETLSAMGMPEAFSNRADFSGMDGTKELFLSTVVHSASVEVNEEGAEAAGATGVVMERKGKSPPVFRANHPFIFMIRHKATGIVFFLGRIANPTK